MAWQGIEGHDEIAARFAAANARGRISGAYLFVGPPGVGKGTFALALAKAVVCAQPRPGMVACGTCASCMQAAAGSHPDIDVVRKPEDRATIPLDLLIGDDEHRMREGLCWQILLRPALGTRKVAVVMDADHLAEEGANCLLKTLEEPPAGSVIILVAPPRSGSCPRSARDAKWCGSRRCRPKRYGGSSPPRCGRRICPWTRRRSHWRRRRPAAASPAFG